MDIDVSQIAYVPTTGVRRVHQTPLIVASNASLDGYGLPRRRPGFLSD